MAWVDSYDNCETCGGKGTLYSSFNCRTMDEYQFCLRCGSNQDMLADRDDSGKIRLHDGKLYINDPVSKPYGGAYGVFAPNGVGEFGFLPPNTSDEDIEAFKVKVAENDGRVGFLSVWRDDTLQILVDADRPWDDDECAEEHDYQPTDTQGYEMECTRCGALWRLLE